MFFTPGRILGMIALTLVFLALGALLKMLDARISTPVGDEASAPEPAPVIAQGRPAKGARRRKHH